MQNNKIYVGNLSYALDEAGLRDSFNEFGEITELTVPKDRVTGRSRGFAFITFKEATQAEAALKMDQVELSGRKVVVKFAESKTEGGNRDRGGRREGRNERSDRW